jgi:hypothetical protein
MDISNSDCEEKSFNHILDEDVIFEEDDTNNISTILNLRSLVE